MVNTRKEYNFLFSVENQLKEKTATEEVVQLESQSEPTEEVERLDTQIKAEEVKTGLDTNNPYNLKYQGNEANYQIKGFNINQLDSLKITLQIQIK